MDKLNLFSLNVRGMRTDKRKRMNIFNTFTQKYNGIVFLQETHSTIEIENKWRSEWEGQIIFAHGHSRSKGVAILLPKKLDDHINNTYKDPNGRFILLDITSFDESYILVNIYAPTQLNENTQLLFIIELTNNLAKHEDRNIVIG